MKPGYRVAWATVRSLLWLIGVRYTDAHKVPATGPLILAPNHRSYLDPPITGCGLHRELSFFAKSELFRIPLLGPIIRGLNARPVRRGESDRRALKLAIETVREGAALVVFAEGTRAPKGGFLEPKPGLAMMATRAGATVVPVAICGTGEGIRGILLSAMRRKRIEVQYGDPISAPSTKDYPETTEMIMDRIRNLHRQTELRREVNVSQKV